MAPRIQILRSGTAGSRPASKQYGEPYVNVADNQFGVVDNSNVARDLLGVPMFSAATSYAIGNPTNYQGKLYIADQAITPAARNPQNWSPAAPFDALAYNGLQINGSHDVTQNITAGTGTPGNGYVMDNWYAIRAGTSAGYSFTGGGSNIFAGIPNYLGAYITTAEVTLASTDYYIFQTMIESQRMQRLNWGYGSPQPITLAFWTAHHRTGLYGGSIRNSGQNKSYVFSYTQAAADVPQYNVITIPGEATGGVGWGAASMTATGMYITFAMACGTGYQAAAGAWTTSSNFLSVTGQVNGVGATTDYFRLAGLMVLPGSDAPSSVRSPYIMRPFDQELLTCQRYYKKSYAYLTNPGTVTTAGMSAFVLDGLSGITHTNYWTCYFGTPMRAPPTVTLYNPSTGAAGSCYDGATGTNNAASANFISTTGFIFQTTTSVANGTVNQQAHYVADARM